MSHQLSESKHDKNLLVDGDGRKELIFVLLQVMIGGT
jgi:hypothetical protein